VSNRLSGKVCIIIGAGGGMGRGAALTFAREGALVVAACTSRKRKRRLRQFVLTVERWSPCSHVI
jgi:NAD(P)-dependent dehydrogenase (short-subunit alcohol dehydrogenase family)